MDVRRMAEAHYREIWSVLRRLGVPPTALDDATQHVFMVAAGKAAGIAPGSERAFLMSVAVRTAANARRASFARRNRESDEDVASVADRAPQPDELVEQRRLRSLLDEALDALGPDQRPPFVLFELEGLTLGEIAQVLSVPRGTVASRLRRARETFQATVRRLRSRDGFRGGPA